VRVQKEKDPVVEIRVKDHKERIRVEVADHGPGVSDDYKKEMLERGLKEGQKYLTGVGLILSRTLIERYQGSLHVEDRIRGDPCKGACFVITMPRT